MQNSVHLEPMETIMSSATIILTFAFFALPRFLSETTSFGLFRLSRSSATSSDISVLVKEYLGIPFLLNSAEIIIITFIVLGLYAGRHLAPRWSTSHAPLVDILPTGGRHLAKWWSTSCLRGGVHLNRAIFLHFADRNMLIFSAYATYPYSSIFVFPVCNTTSRTRAL